MVDKRGGLSVVNISPALMKKRRESSSLDHRTEAKRIALMSYFDFVPREILVEIFSFLVICDYLSVLLVCKRWNNILSNHWNLEPFWERPFRYIMRYGVNKKLLLLICGYKKFSLQRVRISGMCIDIWQH